MLAISLKGRIVKLHPFKPETFRNREIKSDGWILKTESTRSSNSKNLVPTLFTWYCKLLYECLKYLLKQIFLATPSVENKCWTSYESFESTGEMKVMKFFHVFAQCLRTLKFVFSRSHGKLFSVLFQATIYILRFKKMWKGLWNT